MHEQIEKIYGLPISPFSMRVELMLRAKGSQLSLAAPEDGVHSEAFRSQAPIGKIPAMELKNGRVLGESEVIAEFLEEALQGPELLPAGAVARAEARLTARIADIYVMNRMLPLFRQLDPSTRDRAIVESAIADVLEGVGWLENQLVSGGEGKWAPYAVAAVVPIILYVERVLPFFGKTDPLSAAPVLKELYQSEAGREPASTVVQSMDEALSAAGL